MSECTAQCFLLVYGPIVYNSLFPLLLSVKSIELSDAPCIGCQIVEPSVVQGVRV